MGAARPPGGRPGLAGWRGVGAAAAAIITGVALTLAQGCSSAPPVPLAAAAAPTPRPATNRVVATASVLITDEVRGPVARIGTIEVSPEAIVADIGATVPLAARVLSSAGTALDDADLVWVIADPRAGSVSEDGVFRAGTSPGTYRNAVSVSAIRNTRDGIDHAEVSLHVTVVGEAVTPTLASVIIYPERPTILSGQIFRLRAAGFDQSGVLIPGVNFVWQLVDPTIGELNSIGYLTAQGPPGFYANAIHVAGVWAGARVSATTSVSIVDAPKAADLFTVQILPQTFSLDPGDQLTLRAIALNGLGEVVHGTQLRWSVADARVGVIDGSGGFTAGALPGVYTESVIVEAAVLGEQGFVRAQDRATVVIRQKETTRRLHTLWVVPERVVTAVGGRAVLTVRTVDESGDPASDVSITWDAGGGSAGRVDANGGFRATGLPGVHPGAVTVTAAQEIDGEVITRTGSVDVIITGTLTELSVSPTLATVAPGKIVHFSAEATDENGIELPDVVVRWRVADDRVGTIDAFGNFTAGQAPGLYEAIITAEATQTVP